MTERQRICACAEILETIYPEAECSLDWGGEPFRLMVLVRLSAQCTDARVNIVGRELFSVFPTAESLAEAPVEEIEKIVRPCGLHRTTARDIKDEMILLTGKYHGIMPSDMDELLSFPGVGRKIANLLRGDIFGLPAVVADTHCIRICGRIGLYPESLSDPLLTEKKLSGLLPPEKTSDFCHRVVVFGREYCKARSPRCSDCPIASYCLHHTKAGELS